MTTYTVELDLNRNNQFDHADSDISAFVQDVSWTFGLKSAYERIAQPASATIIVRNNGEFDEENPSSTYYNLLTHGVIVRIRTIDNASVQRDMFYGKLTGKQVTLGNHSTVQLSFSCQTDRLLDTRWSTGIRRNLRTDEAILAPLSEAVVPYPYDGYYFLLDHDSLDDPNSPIFDPSVDVNTSFDTGTYEIEYIGDVAVNDRGDTIRTYIDDVLIAEGEGSRFFWDARNAKWAFHNVTHDALNNGPSLTLDVADEITSAHVRRDDDLINQIDFIYHPRDILDDDTIVYTLNRRLTIQPGKTRKLTARFSFSDDKETRVAVTTLKSINANDVTSTDESDGSGNDMFESLRYDLDYDGRRAIINITNNGVTTAYIHDLRLRGEAIVNYGPETIEQYDVSSVNAHDLIPAQSSIVAEYVDTEVDALALADYYLSTRSTPFTRFETVTVNIDKEKPELDNILALTIGDVIQVVDTKSHHDRNYAIVGEQHAHNSMSGFHNVTFILRPVERSSIFVLDSSELDGTDKLFWR